MDRNYLVIDLEATCWGPSDVVPCIEGSKQPVPNEIIEIGLSILNPQRGVLWEGGWFVKPRLSSILSPFCVELTSIQQQDLANAPGFPAAMDLMQQQIRQVTGKAPQEALFVSWGNYDRKQFEKDCKLHAYTYPFGEHLNLKQVFLRQQKLSQAGLTKALELLGLPLLGTHHRGVDDARNTARILQVLAV